MPVYFALRESDGAVKIGRTVCIDQRLPALKREFGGDIRIIRTIRGHAETERWFHAKFRDRRISGEWFRFSPEMLNLRPPRTLKDLER